MKDGAVADGTSGAQDQVSLAAEPFRDAKIPSIFNENSEAHLADVIRVQINGMYLIVLGETLQQGGLVADESDRWVVIVGGNVLGGITGTQLRPLIAAVHRPISKKSVS